MIPKFVSRGADAGNLPPGQWVTTWPEFFARYRRNAHRLELLNGLRAALDNLRAAGCQRVYINGSFVTGKEYPGDFDGCWEVAGVDENLLHPCLLVLRPPRTWQKATFQGEWFPMDSRSGPRGTAILDYFQHDKQTGRPKGIIVLDL